MFPPFMVESSTFHGRVFHLSWSSLPPLDFKKPQNTSFPDRRYQEGYQENYQESYQVYLSRANRPFRAVRIDSKPQNTLFFYKDENFDYLF
jgi:hypothetical protein